MYAMREGEARRFATVRAIFPGYHPSTAHNTAAFVGAWVGFSLQFCISKVGRRLDFAS
jgi:hypothetical protein